MNADINKLVSSNDSKKDFQKQQQQQSTVQEFKMKRSPSDYSNSEYSKDTINKQSFSINENNSIFKKQKTSIKQEKEAIDNEYNNSKINKNNNNFGLNVFQNKKTSQPQDSIGYRKQDILKYKEYDQNLNIQDIDLDDETSDSHSKNFLVKENRNLKQNLIKAPTPPLQQSAPQTKFELFSNFGNYSFIESCCLQKKANGYSSEQPTNLATCVHFIKGGVSTLTDRLKQFKLRWYFLLIVFLK
jgi:hypothetical protein